MLVYIRTKTESREAFQDTGKIEEIVKKYYPEDSFVLGETPSTMDIKTFITADNTRVNILSLLGVFLVVMFSFRSLLVPVIVMIPIEAAIFLNMAVPYLCRGYHGLWDISLSAAYSWGQLLITPFC